MTPSGLRGATNATEEYTASIPYLKDGCMDVKIDFSSGGNDID
jgi:hypothetical protein